ncbi:hypothetical protein HUA76_02305 [Myxococcus sp. CA056]|uniref:hypothetical protein n=1 Tax=unclassified Myxococcus TaxID=2648731 RepID=UPI00157A5326|nr:MULTISPECIES: hypothetical protein [unclassified Myxococcus]NTX09605.1 hypothetical protein [Myxococcus sp. CA056]
MFDHPHPWAWAGSSLLVIAVGALAIRKVRQQRHRRNWILTHGRRVKATLREVTYDSMFAGDEATMHLRLLMHEGEPGKDWLVEQVRLVHGRELILRLVPGTVLDVAYDPADRENRPVILQVDGDTLM